MEMTPTSAISDEREEGEIVDDDFEDISDNSIIVSLYPGKSVSSNEHLPAISLSSVSDVEVENTNSKEKIHRRKKIKNGKRRNSKAYRKRRNSHRRSHSGSNSDDLELDRKLQKQIKAAIRRDDNEECLKTNRNISLRSRLRAMTKLENDSDTPLLEKIEIVQPNNHDHLELKPISDESDIEELRLEALRTTWLNKWAHRKKRKIKEIEENDVLSDISVKTDTSETNKENTHNTNGIKLEEPCNKKSRLEIKENKVELTNQSVMENITSPEDDEDVLRALLLASMSKKITNEVEPKLQTASITPERENVSKQNLTTKIIHHDTKGVSVKNVHQFKKIIVKNNKVLISNNQLVKLPKVKPLIINVTGNSDSEDELFSKTIKNTPKEVIESKVDIFLKQERAKAEAVSPQLSPVSKPILKSTKPSVILEKSSVKLLPKQKQIEYQTLLQKLKNAETRIRIRRPSHKSNGVNQIITNISKKLVSTKVVPNKQPNSSKVNKIADIRNEARALHKVLKDMQIKRNGRLQIQEKYKVLTSIVRKINEASIERKKHDQEVKRLLEELAEAKLKLEKSHEKFTSHVKELIARKEEVDKSLKNQGVEVEKPTKHFTSTPIKETLPLDSLEASSIPSTTSNRSLPLGINEAILDTSANIQEEGVGEFNPGDPNDIDKIYGKRKNTLPKYISPLDNVKREDQNDPFSIVCPYEVGGNCRDPECSYRHFFK